jgi:hypothetical protein
MRRLFVCLQQQTQKRKHNSKEIQRPKDKGKEVLSQQQQQQSRKRQQGRRRRLQQRNPDEDEDEKRQRWQYGKEMYQRRSTTVQCFPATTNSQNSSQQQELLAELQMGTNKDPARGAKIHRMVQWLLGILGNHYATVRSEKTARQYAPHIVDYEVRIVNSHCNLAWTLKCASCLMPKCLMLCCCYCFCIGCHVFFFFFSLFATKNTEETTLSSLKRLFAF